jgi:NAD-dependent dihydropyrimidine dehydrogenase PreA subunit
MGRFIKIAIDTSVCPAECSRCVEVCPVEIFEMDGGKPSVRRSEEDECTLCELCLQRCPQGAIRIEKLY